MHLPSCMLSLYYLRWAQGVWHKVPVALRSPVELCLFLSEQKTRWQHSPSLVWHLLCLVKGRLSVPIRRSNGFAVPGCTSAPGCLGLLNPGVRWCAATLWPQEGTVGAHSPGFNTRSLLNESGHDSNWPATLDLLAFLWSLPEEATQLYFTCTRGSWHLEGPKVTPVVKEKHYPIVCIFGSFKVWRLSGRLKVRHAWTAFAFLISTVFLPRLEGGTQVGNWQSRASLRKGQSDPRESVGSKILYISCSLLSWRAESWPSFHTLFSQALPF